MGIPSTWNRRCYMGCCSIVREKEPLDCNAACHRLNRVHCGSNMILLEKNLRRKEHAVTRKEFNEGMEMFGFARKGSRAERISHVKQEKYLTY